MNLPAFLAAALLGVTLCLPSLRATTAVNLSSFDGLEEPVQVYQVAAEKFTKDGFANITDQGGGTFRMQLRYHPTRWDGDRSTGNTDRQRAEARGLGPRQTVGETFEYSSTWRTNPEFVLGAHFCHVMQVKGFGGGEIAAPLVALSVMSQNSAAVRYVSGTHGFQTARLLPFSAGQWRTVKIRLKVSTGPAGELRVSLNGDTLRGKTGVPMFRPGASEYQPKWGLYRGVDTKQPFGDDFLEHRAVTANKL